jgi:hypothetical protein
MKRSFRILLCRSNKSCFDLLPSYLPKSIICLLILFAPGCDSDSPEDPFIGTWELEQLVINGIDTTSFIKNDTNCYGYTRLFIREDERNSLIQDPFYNVGANFHCLETGYWYFYGGPLVITIYGSHTYVGPYLTAGTIEWEVLEISEIKMRLSTTYQSMPCYLTYKRKW